MALLPIPWAPVRRNHPRSEFAPSRCLSNRLPELHLPNTVSSWDRGLELQLQLVDQDCASSSLPSRCKRLRLLHSQSRKSCCARESGPLHFESEYCLRARKPPAAACTSRELSGQSLRRPGKRDKGRR